MLTEKEKDILKSMVSCWDESKSPLAGGISYNAVFAFLEKMGLDPKKCCPCLNAFIDDVEAGKYDKYKPGVKYDKLFANG